MIEIKNKKNKFTYNVYHVTKAFFPEEEIVQTVDEEQEPAGMDAVTGRSLLFPCREKSDGDRQKNDS